MTASPSLPGRSAGLLLHVTSLPSRFGIGDLGPAARAWIDALARAGISWWQVLPLGPTGYGDSPYQSLSAFAGNPNLVSPEDLVRDGLLREADLPADDFPTAAVDYARVIPVRAALTLLAWDRFQAGAALALVEPFAAFVAREAGWLEDFALFLALKEAHGLRSWHDWPEPFAFRQPQALAAARRQLAAALGLHRFRQFLFARQWQALRSYAHARAVRLIGDMPIFVADDSTDVWAHPELFLLDAHRRPTVVAGVPPDYFAATGQLWGNPHYDWPAHEATGYAWWLARLQATLTQVDLVRLDHFRGFEAAWHVPAADPTAQHGRWVPGPASPFFDHLRRHLGSLPLIAEDLGFITPAVDALRTAQHLPGMRILQFAFGGATESRFLPHTFDRATVVYTGTHDNDTTLGWLHSLAPAERLFFRRYVPPAGPDAAWDLIRLAWASVADLAVAPVQDVLSLGSEARMNRPGEPAGNWRWRAPAAPLPDHLADRLLDLTDVCDRAPRLPSQP